MIEVPESFFSHCVCSEGVARMFIFVELPMSSDGFPEGFERVP